eukprot:CAMPEP_0194423840 /NCGR_PEP_ID=MMETSP0176-20130528/23113_1 /TAXON_ID=216777 /ORGANISM="Proboscia alata, Strain PI-D3" /LENGTH=356 /DNA_ID=CAMNT_0039233289 /DNA_START=1 /DNA_END=1072 /DNA_ORIENTATION=-
MLTLHLAIEKMSTGFKQSITLSSTATTTATPSAANHQHTPEHKHTRPGEDEQVMGALQHSLFCASLFDAIRNEVDSSSGTPTNPNIHSTHNRHASHSQHKIPVKGGGHLIKAVVSQPKRKATTTAWLSSESEETFLPAPSLMRGKLCIVHCQEGEIKVLLDSEYALTIQLVEAGTAATVARQTQDLDDNYEEDPLQSDSDSGSETPGRLRVLCRVLLLHAQFTFHDYCMTSRSKGSAGVTTEIQSPQILEACVGLGSKMLLERKIRATLTKLSDWISQTHPNAFHGNNTMVVQWAPLSTFDAHSHFVVSVGGGAINITVDVHIDGGNLNVTNLGGNGNGNSSDVNFDESQEKDTGV